MLYGVGVGLSESTSRSSESEMKERLALFSLWRFVIVYSCHEFGLNNFPNKGMRIVISNNVRSGPMRCAGVIADVCEPGLLKTNVLPQFTRKLPFNIRLRGGKGIQGDGTKKRQRKTLGAGEVGDQAVEAQSILYQPGGAGFGKVEVVSKPKDSVIPDMEDPPEGGAPLFEVNLTEMRENQDDSGTDNNPKENSQREWYFFFQIIFVLIYCPDHITIEGGGTHQARK